MEAPNIVLKVKHNTKKQGKVFSDAAYAAMRKQLANLLTVPYVHRLKDVWCDDNSHKTKETIIIIDADTNQYEIDRCCCNDYERKINNALVGVEDER